MRITFGDLVAINVFEGARRISKTIMLIIVVGSLIAIWYDAPYLTLTYEIALPGEAPVRVEECSKDSDLEVLDRYSTAGNHISVRLCFRAYPGDKAKEMRIPFKVDDDKSIWIGNKFSTPVVEYTQAAARDFQLPADDMKDTGFLLLKQRLSKIGQGIGMLALAIFSFLLATSFIGWIVRGFLGIPNGMDARPEVR